MSQINKFMHVSRETHLNVIERILQYLKGTIGKRILMINNNSNNIYGYFDADWAGSFINNELLAFSYL
jgi:hypothetical protein